MFTVHRDILKLLLICGIGIAGKDQWHWCRGSTVECLWLLCRDGRNQ